MIHKKTPKESQEKERWFCEQQWRFSQRRSFLFLQTVNSDLQSIQPVKGGSCKFIFIFLGFFFVVECLASCCSFVCFNTSRKRKRSKEPNPFFISYTILTTTWQYLSLAPDDSVTFACRNHRQGDWQAQGGVPSVLEKIAWDIQSVVRFRFTPLDTRAIYYLGIFLHKLQVQIVGRKHGISKLLDYTNSFVLLSSV